MIGLRKHARGPKLNRNSLLITGRASADALLQIVLNNGCFRSKDIGSLNAKDTLSVYNYLCSLLAYSVKILGHNSAAGIIVVVDATKVPVKALRLVLKACQNALAFKIKHAVILEPDKFFDQQRLSLDILLENYDFKTSLCSKTKLAKYVNVTDLAEPFCQLFPGTWIDLKRGFEEHFIANPSYITKIESVHTPTLVRFHQKENSIVLELSAPSGGRYSRLFEENDPLAQRVLQEAAMEAAAAPAVVVPRPNRRSVASPIRSSMLLEGPSSLTANEKSPEPEPPLVIAQVCEAAEESTTSTTTQTQSTSTANEEALLELLGNQKDVVYELLAWLQGPGEKWLGSLNDVGESVDEARQLDKQHRQLSTRTEQVVDQAAEVAEVIAFLARENTLPDFFEPLKALADELATRVYEFRKRVKTQALVRANSVRLHEIIAEFYAESDSLLKSLCSEMSALEEQSCQSELEALDKRIAVVEDKFEVIAGVCGAFDGLFGESEGDVQEDRAFVHEQLTLATERRKRCHELLELHKLKLQQMIQLQTCERDQQQVQRWLEELGQSLMNDRFRHGLSPTALAMKLSHFEQSGTSVREYSKQLSQVSLLLRRSLRLETSPQMLICERINSLWRDFQRNLSRHKSFQ